MEGGVSPLFSMLARRHGIFLNVPIICLNCRGADAMTRKAMSYVCLNCGWFIKQRKYCRYQYLFTVPKCVLSNFK